LKQSNKGPLTPAHLREALRRYKRDRDGGGAGFAGMSLEGVERTMARTGGKRLFR
jgi:transcription initiation factor TFIID subunit 11